MHRNRIIAVCVTFCVVAIVAGWIVAGMSTSPGAVIAMQTTGAPSASETSQPIGAGSTAGGAAPTAAAPADTPTPPAPTPSPSPQPAPTAAPTTEPTAEPTAAPAPATAAPAFVEYTVQPGDLLYTIAVDHNVTIEAILALNEIPNPESLTVGQVIRIPQ